MDHGFAPQKTLLQGAWCVVGVEVFWSVWSWFVCADGALEAIIAPLPVSDQPRPAWTLGWDSELGWARGISPLRDLDLQYT